MQDLNRAMDEQLQSRVKDLAAHNDETGDGKLDTADLKAQLNRIEAQLELQDQQNRSIMRNQRIRMVLSIVIAAVLLVVLAVTAARMNTAYNEIMAACEQVNELAATVQTSLDTLDPDELNTMMQQLPGILDQLQQLDVQALNQVLDGLPALMENVDKLQQQAESIANVFNSIGSIFGR